MVNYKRPWRKVLDVNGYHPGGRNGGAYTYTLSCGHVAIRKASAGRPKRVRCDYCPMVDEDGGGR